MSRFTAVAWWRKVHDHSGGLLVFCRPHHVFEMFFLKKIAFNSVGVWACFLLAGMHATCLGQVITDSKLLFQTNQKTGGQIAVAWSPDGRWIMRAERDTRDRIALCLYDSVTGAKAACPYFMKYQPELYFYAIDWSDSYVHVAVGFDHGPRVIYPLHTGEWKSHDADSVEFPTEHANLKPLSGDNIRGAPAWDKWKDGLFCEGENELSGIQFIDKSRIAKKYVSGEFPAVTKNYLWYTALSSDGSFRRSGISRVNKRTKMIERLTDNEGDAVPSPRLDEKGLLFIRRAIHPTRGLLPGRASLFAYVDGKVVGPLLSTDKKTIEKLHDVQLSADGSRALLTVSYGEENETLAVKLLSLRW